MKTALPLLTAAVAAALLAGCDASSPKKTEPAAATNPQTAPPPKALTMPELSVREHIVKALELFGDGRPGKAAEHLRKAREKNPRSRMVAKLLRQLEVDPKVYFSGETFDYKVKKGDTLSELAQQYLGDELEYIALTRYNQLSRPSLLAVGQTLKIPKRELEQVEQVREAANDDARETDEAAAVPMPSVAPPPLPMPTLEVAAEPSETTPETVTETAPSPYEIASSRFENGDFAGTVRAIEDAHPDAAPPIGEQRQLLLHAYGAEAGKLMTAGQLEAAHALLVKANNLDPDDTSVAQQLAQVQDRIEARRLFTRAQAARKAGNLEQAHADFHAAARLAPDESAYALAARNTRDELVDEYHRQALTHYRMEQLGAAKTNWEKVLELDPDNKIAPGYLSKVEEIQLRLRALDGK